MNMLCHFCQVNRNKNHAALSFGPHQQKKTTTKKQKDTSKMPLRLTETGWIILDHVWSRRGEAVERRRRKKRNEWMPAPSGDFSFFPNWGIESRILLSYKPLSLSHHPRDVNHFQPPGPLPQIEGTRPVQRRQRRGSRLFELFVDVDGDCF